MKIEADTVKEYWAAVPDDWRRKKMEALRAMIMEAAPDAKETIGWGMLRYGWPQADGKDRMICHMNAQARFVGFYIGQLERLDTDGAVRDAFDCGKTCVRVKKKDEVGMLRKVVETEAARVRG